MFTRVITILPLLGLVIGSSAADGIDLRATALYIPASKEVNIRYDDKYGYYDYNGSGPELNEGWRLEVGVVGRPEQFSNGVSFLLSGMFFYHNQASSTYGIFEREISYQPGPLSLTVLGVDVHAAIEFSLTPYLELEFGPFVGVGGSTVIDTAVGADSDDSRIKERGHGDYMEAGFNLSLHAHNRARNVIVGLGVRYFVGYTEADLRWNYTTADGGLNENVEIRLEGLAPQLSISANF